MGFETHVPKHPKRYLDRALEKHKRHLALVPDKLKPLFRATFKAGIRVGVLKRVLATTRPVVKERFMAMPTDRDAYNVVCHTLGLPYDSSLVAVCDTLAKITSKRRYKLLSDDDGHHYLVPVENEEKFNEWVDSFNEEEGDPDGYEKLDAESLGCSPTCVSFTCPKVD
jgi:hypothetical protein